MVRGVAMVVASEAAFSTSFPSPRRDLALWGAPISSSRPIGGGKGSGTRVKGAICGLCRVCVQSSFGPLLFFGVTLRKKSETFVASASYFARTTRQGTELCKRKKVEMGRKAKWSGAVKRTFTPYCCQGNPKVQESKLIEKGDEQRNHAYSVAFASAADAEPAAIATQAAMEVVHLATSASRHTGESREEIAAVKIQTAYRGYQARRKLRTLRGLVRLKRMLDGNAVKSQTTNTLKRMQMLARVQALIHSRRVRIIEENQALHRHLQRKYGKELENVKIAKQWEVSLQSKEKFEANLSNKQEAAIRRERALAYAFTHQWRSTSRSIVPTFIDPSNPQWGWSWLERWMDAKPWENQSTKETKDHASINSISGASIASTTKQSLECTPSAAWKSRQPQSPTVRCSRALLAASRKKSETPRGRQCSIDCDSRSMFSVQSERPRRRSIAGSSIGDDESLVSSFTLPNYMASTVSSRAKSRSPSPLCNKVQAPEKGLARRAKRCLSFSSVDYSGTYAANARRLSGPPESRHSAIEG